MKRSLFRGALPIRSVRVSLMATALAGLPLAVAAQTAPPPAPQRPVQAVAKPKPVAPVAAAPQPAATTQGAATAKSGAGDDVIARVGSTNISADQIRAYVAALGPRERAAFGQDPNLLGQAVRLMLANRLVLQEITAKKWDQQAAIAEQLERVRESAVVELYLQQVSTPPAGFPSEDELQKVYDANRASFLTPRQFELAQIFVPVAKDADKAAEDTAKKAVEDIQRKLKAPGADFAALANETSDARNADKTGGALGWVAENQIRPEIRSQVMALAKSAIAEPIKLDDGWHIIKLTDTKASYTKTLPEVRELLTQQMRSERAAALRRAYLAELLKQNPPVINELALSGLIGGPAPAAR
ncbi:peptidylprolyl isomerase [Bradyrhizobium sp. BRP22]|uniref:peptidylprolyl isomerase n=1 Tax=Bradyrhizobium sp. BRP22 TaxID=2793821 RepID=UPI001CD25F1B|nr:peptidylprolyl isomerase [Bradyrhizobium sp. BRP22]MCA1452487.1 peptidylprolyl isomerase [Bradyrhizobium sp. BRP22]